MYCGKCGAPNPDDNRFCSSCGSQLNGNNVGTSSFDTTSSNSRPVQTNGPVQTNRSVQTNSLTTSYKEYKKAQKKANKKPAYKTWWFWAAIALVMLAIATSGDTSNLTTRLAADTSTTKTSSDSTSTKKDVKKMVDNAVSDVVKEVKKDPIDDLPLGQKNAIKSAQSYLNYAAFSRKGLLQQLTSEYGEKFPQEDAEFALGYLEKNNLVDWKEQAYLSSKSYINFSAFSRKGLIQQLTSDYGEQFTQEEAEYGVSKLENAGEVDWKEQAAKSAKSYLDFSSFSKAELIQQLTSDYGEQFTQEEAEYGVKAVGY